LSGERIVEAKQQALKNGCLDALLVKPLDRVIGSTEGDIFIVVNGTVINAPKDAVELTSAQVGSIADRESIPLVPRSTPLLLADVVAADEVFVAGISCGIIAIVRVDGKPIGLGTEGPIAKRIREAYCQLTRGSD